MATFSFYLKRILLWTLPLLVFLLMQGSVFSFLGTPSGRLVLLSAWMILWWACEVVPIPVTSLIPIIFFPLCGVATQSVVAESYSRPIIFLFMGGFFLARGLEKTGLHKRLALQVLLVMGGSYQGILLAFMITSFFLSMWISNTATTLLMLSVGTGVLTFFAHRDFSQESSLKDFGSALFLAIAYSSSVGGVTTLIGTPPNGLLVAYLKEHHEISLSMLSWMTKILPLALILLFVVWWWLTKVFFHFPEGKVDVKGYLHEEQKKLGVLSYDEKIVAFVLLLTSSAWLSKPILIQLTGLPLSDAIIALFGALLLFTWPSQKKRSYILDWDTAVQIPWGVLLMFGGGLSLASAFESTGLVDLIALYVKDLPELPHYALLGLFSGGALFLTEVLTNSAAMATLLPLLSVFAERYDLALIYLAIPSTLACSFAFMLPIATPPNAIVFGTGKVSLRTMISCGLGLNLMVLLALFLYFGFLVSV